MHVRRIELAQFRCHEQLALEFGPRLTVVTGENACGKTSLLEALGWLATQRSFRGAPDAALVRSGEDQAIVRAEISSASATHPTLVEAEIQAAGRNRVLVNHKPLRRVAEMVPVLRVSVFLPDDLALIKEGPAARRDYIDDLLAALVPRYDAVRRDYERVLLQRNRLLRSGVRTPTDLSTLDIWDTKLAGTGAMLAAGRLWSTHQLSGPLRRAYERVAGMVTEVVGEYRGGWFDVGALDPREPSTVDEARTVIENMLTEAIGGSRKIDIDRGTSTVGPHRDDLHLTINGLDARFRASQGEQRCLALALRLAAHELVAEVTSTAPVVLLDDIFSELDPKRAEALVTHLPAAQTIVTTAGVLPGGLTGAEQIVMDPVRQKAQRSEIQRSETA